MADLLDYLASTPPGKINDTQMLEHLLAQRWQEFKGDDEGMAGFKLRGRMEQVEWLPPVLTFVIERHGGTCCGSTRADLQRWELDVDRMTATATAVGHRQLCPTAERFNIKALAEELAGLIVGGQEDDWLAWREDGTVQVRASSIFPEKSGFKRTVASRRHRLHDALVDALAGTGWAPQGRHVFVRGETGSRTQALPLP